LKYRSYLSVLSLSLSLSFLSFFTSSLFLLHFSQDLPSLCAFTQQGCSQSLPAALAFSQQVCFFSVSAPMAVPSVIAITHANALRVLMSFIVLLVKITASLLVFSPHHSVLNG